MDVAKDIDKWIERCTDIYGNFGGLLNDASEAIKNGIYIFPGNAGVNTVETIMSAIEGTCYTMLAVFFLIDLINTYLNKGEEMRWEDVARMVIKLLICKNLVMMAPVILSVLQSTVATTIMQDGEINNAVNSIVTQCIELMTEDLSQYRDQVKNSWSIKNAIHNMGVSMNVLMTGIANYGLALIITAMGFSIKIFSYLRSFELTILSALCGIPLTFYAYSETKDIPKRFLLNYLAVCLQGLVIMVCLTLYSFLLPTTDGKLGILVWTGTVAFSIARSGQWAKDTVGQ